MQVSVRKRFSEGYQFDVNYTLGYAKDHGVAARGRRDVRATSTTAATPASCIDSWDPDKQYGNADYDVRHLVNMNWIADLPFGRGTHFGSGHARRARRHRRRLVHGGRRSAWTQRLPVQRPQLPSVLDDELGPAGQRRAGRPPACCRRRARRKNVINGYPSPFEDPADGARLLPARASRVRSGCATCCAATATSRSTSA